MFRTLFKIRYKDNIFKVQSKYCVCDFGGSPYAHFNIKSNGEKSGFYIHEMDTILLSNLVDNIVEYIMSVQWSIDNKKNLRKTIDQNKEAYKAFLANKDLLREAVVEKLSNVK